MKKKLSFCLRSALLLTGLLVFIIKDVHSQFAQPYRYEHEQKNSDDHFHIISLKEKGLALFRERDKYKQNNKIWELIFLDSTLHERKTTELEIKERNHMIGYEVTDKLLYFLFRAGETNKNDLSLMEVDFDGNVIKTFDVKPDLDFKLTHFIKAGDNFVFGGYVSSEAVIVLFDPATSNLKVVPGFFQKDTELVDVRTNANQTFNTVLFDRSNKAERKLIFKTFDPTGVELLNDVVNLDPNTSLQSGISSSLEREELMIAGTFGEKNSKQSNGFFIVPVNPFADQKIEYYNFGELKHFVDYLPEKRAQRIKENTLEDVKAGRKPSFSAYITPFKLVEDKDGFYLLAEVYTPSATTQNNSNPFFYNPYYGPYSYYPYSYWPGYYYPGMSRMYRPYMFNPSQRTIDEVKTMATVVFSFDQNGKPKWDQSVKLEDVKLPAMSQVGDFHKTGNELFLVYKLESEIKLKRALLNEDTVTETSQKVKTLSEKDEIRSEKESESGVRFWYGNSFYVWGYQSIRNNSNEDRLRDVFYINRIDP